MRILIAALLLSPILWWGGADAATIEEVRAAAAAAEAANPRDVAPWTHSLYFLSYAVIATAALIVMASAFYSRYRREGVPINYSLLMLVGGVALAMWTGVGLTELFYNVNTFTSGLAAFFLGTTISTFLAWLINKVVKRIEEEKARIQELATHDALTGLWNFRMFHELLSAETARAVRFDQPLTLMIVDVDNMTAINAAHGVKSGDMVIRQLGERLTTLVRVTDQVCRYGGDQLALILPQTDAIGARQFARRLAALVIDNPFDLGNGQLHPAQLSVGSVGTADGVGEDHLLVSTAMQVLSIAIEQGGDRVGFHSADREEGPVMVRLSDPEGLAALLEPEGAAA